MFVSPTACVVIQAMPAHSEVYLSEHGKQAVVWRRSIAPDQGGLHAKHAENAEAGKVVFFASSASFAFQGLGDTGKMRRRLFGRGGITDCTSRLGLRLWRLMPRARVSAVRLIWNSCMRMNRSMSWFGSV